jgi:dTDP-4-dehydrorhamnose reductase
LPAYFSSGWPVAALGHEELDVTDPDSLDAAFGEYEPGIVLHCAALTDTNRCEREPELAREINGIGAETIAKGCRRWRARLVAISTNEVFGGEKREPYNEDDATHPLNAYAVSKLDGEVLAAAANPDTLVVRTSWLYGDGYVNFNEKVLAAAREGRPLSFVTDEIATPTSTDELADAIARLIENDAAPPGVYHLANSGEASRYDWAREVLRLAGMGDVAVAAVTTAELRANGYAGPVKPEYSVLANNRGAAFGAVLGDWRVALERYFARSRAAADA